MHLASSSGTVVLISETVLSVPQLAIPLCASTQRGSSPALQKSVAGSCVSKTEALYQVSSLRDFVRAKENLLMS